jgi:hypothetical protein
MIAAHNMTVGQLKELLNTLQDSDVIVPNMLRNLAVYREDLYIGVIDFLEGHQYVDLLTPEEALSFGRRYSTLMMISQRTAKP